MQLERMIFSVLITPIIISDGPFNLRRYYADDIRSASYVEAGQSIQFQVATVGDGGEATCFVSGYLLDAVT